MYSLQPTLDFLLFSVLLMKTFCLTFEFCCLTSFKRRKFTFIFMLWISYFEEKPIHKCPIELAITPSLPTSV